MLSRQTSHFGAVSQHLSNFDTLIKRILSTIQANLLVCFRKISMCVQTGIVKLSKNAVKNLYQIQVFVTLKTISTVLNYFIFDESR